MRRSRSEQGFTLIELVVVVAVMPLVIGAITVGLLSVFHLQTQVSGSLTDSGDEQVVAADYQPDVEAATMITTDSSPSGPPPCQAATASGTEVLGVELAGGTYVSYMAQSAPGGATTDLYRNVCDLGNPTPNPPVLVSSRVILRDAPASMLQASTWSSGTPTPQPPVQITCVNAQTTACAPGPPPANIPAYASGWVAPQGITKVTFQTIEPESKYNYTLAAVPLASQNSTQLGVPTGTTNGVNFALPGTGTYAATLGFVNFAAWNTQTANGNQHCSGGALSMAVAVPNSPYTLSFCIAVSTTSNSTGKAITGAQATCAITSNPGQNGITAVPLPTYASPPTSEAFLGNNGFYTGVQGDPALYECDEGSTATVTITALGLQNSNGIPVSGWQLVTGDAESTDQSETITWISNQPLTLLPNSPNSDVGNACGSTPPGYNATYLTGLNPVTQSGTTVECATPPGSASDTDKTGTVMLTANAPSSLTVKMFGTGLQGMFMGIALP